MTLIRTMDRVCQALDPQYLWNKVESPWVRRTPLFGDLAKLLLTGGAGFIGSTLVRRLAESGHEPAVSDDFCTGLESNLSGLGIRIHRGTLADLA